MVVAARSQETPVALDTLLHGDVIYALNGTRIETLAGLQKAAGTLRGGSLVALQIQRETGLRFVAFVLD